MSERIERQQIFKSSKHRKFFPAKDQLHPDALENQRQKNQALISLLREWMADESGRQEREWPIIKKALDEDRPSYRRLFND